MPAILEMIVREPNARFGDAGGRFAGGYGGQSWRAGGLALAERRIGIFSSNRTVPVGVGGAGSAGEG